MWKQTRCWWRGHEEWSSPDGAWFCMHCRKSRNLDIPPLPVCSSHTPLDRSVAAAFATLGERRRLSPVPSGRRQVWAGIMALLTSLGKRRTQASTTN